MKIFILMLLFVGIGSSWALAEPFDSEMFYDYAVYSTVYVHEAGNSGDIEMADYQKKMKDKYPEFMSEEWAAYGQNILKDEESQKAFCSEITRRLKQKGYDSQMVEIGSGLFTVNIVK